MEDQRSRAVHRWPRGTTRAQASGQPAPRPDAARLVLFSLVLTACALVLLVAGALVVPAARLEAAGPVGASTLHRLHLPLIQQSAGGPQPGATATPSRTAKPSKTPEPSETPKPTSTANATSSATPAATETSTPTSTAVETATATNTPTATQVATATPTPSPVAPPLNTSHAGRFTTYEGSKTCMTCHLKETQDMHGSQHYQWNGPAPYAAGLTTGGKLGAINDFCGYPDINWLSVLTNLDGQPTDGGCATCHAGMGARPSKDQTQAQLENIDCLTCHSETYKRKVINDGGTFKLVAAPERMTVPLEQAITDIKKPTKANCLTCHVASGGGPNNKRGDLEPSHSDPPRTFDVHMASKANGGAGLLCQSCHITQDHHIAGRGSDMRATDLDQPVKCTNCHAQKPHGNKDIDKHTAKLECSVCHIPTFAKVTSTDMFRDFRTVEVLQSKRLYEPTMERQSNVVPDYRWFNGTSTFYEFGAPVTYGPSGRVVMSQPNGGVNDPNARIFGFKHHEALQAHDPVSNRILPMKMGILFQDGNVDLAIKKGVEAVGWSLPQGYDWVPTERWLSINHEVTPHEQALTCDTCHATSAKRMDWAALGYTPKTTRNGKPLCQSCHGQEDEEWSNRFYGVHKQHVTEERIACSECHNFSR